MISNEIPPRPPSRLNGKENPAWRFWYRHYTESGRNGLKRWATSKGAKTALEKYKKTAKYKAMKERSGFPVGEASMHCRECKAIYRRSDVLARGWRVIGDHGCICDLCDEP